MDGRMLVLAVALGAAHVWWQVRRLGRLDLDAVARKADEEFRQLSITEGPPELCFDGRNAEIVCEGRDYDYEYRVRVTCLRRYARNAHGEYFYFLSEGTGRPYFRHIEQSAAKAALGKRYRAPPPSTSV